MNINFISSPPEISQKDRLFKKNIHLIINLIFQKKVEIFNENNLKKMLNQFEKKMSKNQEMRIKFSDAPEKFVVLVFE